MKKAKDMFRIRANIGMVFATIALCIVYVISGKQALERGETVVQQNKERHGNYQKSS
jgi:hypothetical protein